MSIGATCKTRNQIDHYMRGLSPDLVPQTHFFDRLFLGKIEGVINLVERDFRIDESDICIKEIGGKFIPADARSGMAFLHDFGTRRDFWPSYEDCQAALNGSMKGSLAKYRHIAENTIRFLASNSVALVYYTNERSDVVSLKAKYDELLSVLVGKYEGDFHIINIVELGGELIDDQYIASAAVDEENSPLKGTSDHWKGWDESWSNAFGSLFDVRAQV